MVRDYEKLNGLSIALVSKRAGVTRQSVYNWLDGNGRFVAFRIEPIIQELLKEKEDDDNGRRQESELEGSIQNPN